MMSTDKQTVTDSGTVPNVVNDVRKDVSELRKLGVTIPKSVDTWIDRNTDEILDLDRNGMRTSDITDLIRALV
jgi:hypothetical protein